MAVVAAATNEELDKSSKTVPKYFQVPQQGLNKDSIWNYFLKEVADGKTAKCMDTSCQKVLKTAGGSTSGLNTHLRSIHHIDLLKKDLNPSELGGNIFVHKYIFNHRHLI